MLVNLYSPLLDFYLQLYAIDIDINTKLAFYSVGASSEPDMSTITGTYLIFR